MQPKLLTALFITMLLAGAIYYDQHLTPNNMQTSDNIDDAGPSAPFPAITFSTPDGKPLHLGDIKEKIILVHFWAAWCAPCQAEFADLLKYVERSGGKIALLAVSLDDHYEDSRKVLEKASAESHVGLKSPYLYWAWDKDKKISLDHFNTVKVPETIVVKDGLMTEKLIGAVSWAEAAPRQ